MTTLGHRLALVELAEIRTELARLADRLADAEAALSGDVLDLRDPGRDEAPATPEGSGR